MRSTFKVLFYVKKGSEKPNGNLPLMCRITVDGEIKQFSCKMDVPPRLWDVKNSRASGKSVEAQKINLAVDKIRVEVNRRYQELMQTDGYVTAAKLKDAYLGIGVKQETLLKLFEQHNAEFEKKVGHSRAQGTFTRYRTVCNHIREFLPHTYRREDIPLKELNLTFINDFEYFLRTEKKCRTNTVWGYMIVLKHIVSIARNNGRLPFNPFAGYINSPESVDRGYLTQTEIQTLMDAPMKNATHELVRDLFVFSVFTGLAYSDVKNLTVDRLQTFFDGNLWIITRRKKTNTESNIRLLDVPKRIIEKYKGLARDGHVFPVPSNGSCNKILKDIGRQCGFKVRLTYHVARHTNATTVLLSHGVPIETVSRLLGHTNIKTTQIYAKITAQKISQDMETLSHKLEDMETNHLIKNRIPMKEERNIITMDGQGNISLPSDIGATAMTEREICELFGVIAPTVRAGIKALCKSGVLSVYDIKRIIRISDKYSAEVYNLETIAALAFRVESFGAAKVRKVLLERIIHGRKEKTKVFVSVVSDGKPNSRWKA